MTPTRPTHPKRVIERVSGRNNPEISSLIDSPTFCEKNSGNLYKAVTEIIETLNRIKNFDITIDESATDDFFSNNRMRFTLLTKHNVISERGKDMELIDIVFSRLAEVNGLIYERDFIPANLRYQNDTLSIAFISKSEKS